MSRILRTLVCLLLICCILINLSPLKARATAVVEGVAYIGSVLGPVGMVAAASVIALGLYAGANPHEFENLCDAAATHLTEIGTNVKDGFVELLQVTDSQGYSQLYVPGDIFADLWSWVYSSDYLCDNRYIPSDAPDEFKLALESASEFPLAVWFYSTIQSQYMIYRCSYPYCRIDAENKRIFAYSDSEMTSVASWGLWQSSVNYWSGSSSYVNYTYAENGIYRFCGSGALDYSTTYDLTLGYLPSEDIELDDETIVTFHPYLADVIRTRSGGSWDPENDPFKWWLGLRFAESLEELYQTSQQAQIENPSVVEIPDLQEGTQYEVTIETDEDGNERYVLSPIYNPGTGTDPGTGDGTDTDPDTGTDSGNGSGNTGTDSGNTGNTGNAGSSWTPPSDHSQFALADLTKFFPFCIPFDLFDFFKLLNADPVAPVFNWQIQDLAGQTYAITIDLSEWDPVAQLFRRLQLFLFVCGLAAASRKYIKW